MSLYICKENQELLWNFMNNNSKIQNSGLKTLNYQQKVDLFKNTIHNIYIQLTTQDLTVSDLNSLNRKTIMSLINGVGELAFQKQKNNENIAINTPPIVENNRKERYINEFEERQKMYHSMIEKKAPENIDFTEKSNFEEQNNDMDELLKKHVKEREQDYQVYENTKKNATSNNIEILKIDNSSNISIQPDIINDKLIPKDNKKSVSWSSDIESENVIYDKFEKLEKKCNFIFENLGKIINEYNNLNDKYETLQKRYKRSNSL